jgi:hypothetical protein
MWPVDITRDTRRDWKEAMDLADRSRDHLSLDEVRRGDRPAFFFDHGEALLFIDGHLFDLEHYIAAVQWDVDPTPLPREILEHGAGIEYGRRHAGECECSACMERQRPRRSEFAVWRGRRRRDAWPATRPAAGNGQEAERLVATQGFPPGLGLALFRDDAVSGTGYAERPAARIGGQ